MTAINMQRMHPANSAMTREGIWIKMSNSTPTGYAHGGKTPFYSYLREIYPSSADLRKPLVGAEPASDGFDYGNTPTLGPDERAAQASRE
jgi:hypothetical protein